MLNTSNNQFAFPMIGALGGGYAYSTMGSIGLVGSFGGVSLGLFSMTAILNVKRGHPLNFSRKRYP